MQPPSVPDLLRQTIGLDEAALGPGAIARVVRERMASCGCSDAATYAELAHSRAPELQALIEAIVVPETWFFRNAEAFAEMVRCVVARTLDGDAPAPLTCLSLPCSTGEEPYSMAMALLEAAVPASRFHIDAVDISERALARARAGTFGPNSFRGDDLAFRLRYFEATEFGLRIRDAVRERVRFLQGNLFSDDFMPGAPRYDVIFCRNLLVYCDDVARDRAVKTIRRLLAPGGVLFVGPSEAGLLVRHGFIWSQTPRAFSFRLAPSSPNASITSAPAGRVARAAPLTPKPALRLHSRPAASAPEPPADLDAAYRFADTGDFAAATRACEEHLRVCEPTPRALVLQGLIREAAGDSERAVVAFRKALFLDAGCVEAIAHLALLLERSGDRSAARLLRDRLQRLPQGVRAAR